MARHSSQTLRSRQAPRLRKLGIEHLESRLLMATEVFTAFPNQAIPYEVPLKSTLSINTSEFLTVLDVNVFLRIDHTWQGDLSVWLSDGTRTSVLIDQVGLKSVFGAGYGADNFGAGNFPYSYLKIDDEGMSDAGDTGIHMYDGGGSGKDDLVGTYQPDRDVDYGYFTGSAGNRPLSNLDGGGGNRDWTLSVRDGSSQYTGKLISWGIELRGVKAGSAEVLNHTLFAAGTDNDDTIKIKPSDGGVNARVDINDITQEFAASSFNLAVVLGQRGNDEVALNKKFRVNSLVMAGPGDDSVQVGGGPGVVAGGPGADKLKGGPLDDVLMGDDGIDSLKGGSGKVPPGDSDLLIGETSLYDAKISSLAAFFKFWAEGADDYNARVNQLRAGTGGAPKLNGSTLFDDDDEDTLTGGKDLDWFIGRANDNIKDRAAGEALDFGGVPQTFQAAAAGQAALALFLPAEASPKSRKRQ